MKNMTIIKEIENWFKICILIAVTILYSSLCDVRPNPTFTSTIFNLSGIMFSIGLGLIVTFNLSGIKNQSYIQKIRQNIKRINSKFIINFIMATIIFLLSSSYNHYSDFNLFSLSNLNMKLNLNVAYNVIILYSIAYFIINFLAIRKLNDDILDRINQETKYTGYTPYLSKYLGKNYDPSIDKGSK